MSHSKHTGDTKTNSKNPEADIIRSELEECLNKKWTYQCQFSFDKRYDEAPNPALHITNLGTVGLPLGDRDADAIKSHAIQAPFGMGERTLVDKSVRDTWEMDANMVAFQNSKWQTFVSGVVKEVCETLGVNFSASSPRCELYKLLLYETGSHFLPHVDTEKADGIFATIIVVLPSRFSGGAAHLSHSGLSTVYDCSATSLCSTTVMAWYTDVTHEIKPIISGYRLALAYNLIHTTTSLRPALSSPESSIQQLRSILQTWTEDNGRSAPKKIIYLLQHKYSQANLRASALKGVDANKVGILGMLAREHGFYLGLASVVCSLSGYADDEGGHRRGWGDTRAHNVGFAEIEEREMTIEDFVDLDGNLISNCLPVNGEDEEEEEEEGEGPCETIPAKLASIVEGGPVDSQEYEGYLGNGAGSLSRCYRRTVLVIWPNYSNFTIQYGEGNVDRACLTLSNVSHEVPSRDDVALADFILGLAAKAPAKAAQSTCHVACLWRDLALWKRAIDTCSPLGKGLVVLDKNEAAFNAISRLGFEDVKSSLETLLKDDVRNAERFAFLNALEAWVASQNSPELSTSVLLWVKAARESVITNLHPPRSQDVDAFVSLALQQGSIKFLADTIIPQITTVASPDFLQALCVKAYDESRFVDSFEVKSQILSDIMSNAISRTQFIKYSKPVHQSRYNYRYTSDQRPEPNPNFLNAGRFFQACVGRFDALAGLLAVQVTDMRHLTSVDVQKHVKEVLLPVLEIIAARVNAGAASPSSTSNLFRLVVDAYIKIVTEDPTGTTRASTRSLIRAATIPEGAELLATYVMPKIEDLSLPDTAVRDFIEELRAHANRIVFPSGYSGPTISSLVTGLCKKYARTVEPSSTQVIKNALELCLGINELDAGTILMQRTVEPSRWNAQYVTNLIPLIPDIRRLSQLHKVPHPGFSFVLQAIVLAWISNVLGPKPKDKSSSHLARLDPWKCNCGDCATVKAFLKNSSQEKRILDRLGVPRCRHLEEHLVLYAKAACTWQIIASTPRAMSLTKSPSLYGFVKWKAQQLKGEDILKAISGSDAELQQILGSHYSSIVAIIRGHASTDQIASTGNAVAGSSRAASTAAEGQPQAKKRRVVDPKDIIDLT